MSCCSVMMLNAKAVIFFILFFFYIKGHTRRSQVKQIPRLAVGEPCNTRNLKPSIPTLWLSHNVWTAANVKFNLNGFKIMLHSSEEIIVLLSVQ